MANRRAEAERRRFFARAREQVEQARRALERAEQARKQAAGADLAQLQREAARRGFVGGVALGLALGLALGAAALAFALWKGEQTRALVAGRAGQVKARAADLAAKVRGAGEGPDGRDGAPAAERASGAAAQGVPLP